MEGDGRRVVVQLVEVDAERAHRGGHDRERRRGEVGVDEPVEAAADAVVVEGRQSLRGQPAEPGGMAGGPPADARAGLAGAEQVRDEHQGPGGGGDPGAPVLAGQVIAEGVPEAKPPEEVAEDRRRGDAPGGPGSAGGMGRRAGSWGGRGVIRPRARVLSAGSPVMRRSPRRIGRPFRRDLRRHGRPGRGIVKGSKIFGGTYQYTST